MKTSHVHLLMVLFTISMLALSVRAADDGIICCRPCEPGGDGWPGSFVFYNYYRSNATGALTTLAASPNDAKSASALSNTDDTRINLTNTSAKTPVAAHLFFVDGDSCSVADMYLCLTPNQTASFLASDLDPGVKGYIIAVAVDVLTGCPVPANFLIGDEYVKIPTGHRGNLGAVAFRVVNDVPGMIDCSTGLAELRLDGTPGHYDPAPRVLAVSNIPSIADGNDTMIIANRVGGNLATGASTIGSLFGILYDDSESAFSFSLRGGGCQLSGSLNNSFPRTTPRISQVIPAGRSGWMKLWATSDAPLLGAVFTFNPNEAAQANAFTGARNLHALTLSASGSLTIPVFPPSC